MASQQIREDFEAAIANFVGMLQLKVDAAETFKNNAANSATFAGQKQIEVNDLFDQTVTKAAEAVTAAIQSYNWANKPEDQIVSGGEYSAYHHRRKAEIAAQQVLTALAGAVVFKGQWNASGNAFPTGTSAGWMYRINTGGTLVFEDVGSKLVSIGDYILKTDTGWTYIDEATDAVKTSRTINGKSLNVDIVLTPSDIQAVAIADLADNATAIAGTDDGKWMSSLKVRQALQNLGVGVTSNHATLTNLDQPDIPSGMYRTSNATTSGVFPRNGIKNATVIVTRQTTSICNMLMMYSNGDTYVRSGGVSWTAWRSLSQDLYGIGGIMYGIIGDLNTFRTGGIYKTSNTGMTNLPNGWAQGAHSLIVGGGEDHTMQIIMDLDSTADGLIGRMAVRRMRNLGTWSAWYEIWTSGNLVKQVSATDNTAGSLLATGAGGLVVGNALDAGASSINANNLINGTIHRYETTETEGTALNLPALGSAGSTPRHWMVFTYGISNRKIQEATEVFGLNTTKGRKFIRVFQDSSWGTWKYLWDTDNLVKQSAVNDATAGRVLLVGAGGLLANAQTFIGDNDANAINITGFFRADTGMLNVPASVLNGSVIANYQRDGNNQYQEIFERNSNARWYRRKFDGTWQSWVKMFQSDSPLSDHVELTAKLNILSLQTTLAI